VTPAARSKVLLVDDRQENLLALEAVLAPLDLHLVSAGSGEEALRALLEDDFAVVLLDVQMPGMDGFETASYIRGRARSRTTPIIFLTAISTDVAHVSRGYESGAVDYILKPFDPMVLRSKVGIFATLERERRARQRADELLDRAWMASPLGMALVDGDHRLLRVNPALQVLTGGRAQPGLDAVALFRAEGHGAARGIVAALLAGEANVGADELTLAAPEAPAAGRERPVAVTAAVVRDAEGRPESVLLQLDDLSERRAAEEAGARLAAERAARSEAEALYERERHIASTLQRDLLPRRLPEAAGVTLSAHFAAGGEGTQVGGDWFDVVPLPGGRLGLIVGDVAGRGVGAAARMGQLRSVARAYAVEGHAPVEVAQRLNLYHQTLRADDMTTFVYAVVEPDLGRLRLVNAGHPPPALVVPGSAPRLLEGCSPALGIAELCSPPEIVVDLPPGATVVLYTDGLVERRGEGIADGLSRLLETMGREHGDVEALREAVVECCAPDDLDDDVTALFVRAERLLGERVRLTLVPDRDALAALRRMLRRWLAEMGVDQAGAGAIVLAANEAWQNAIEHGHDFAPVPISVRFEREDDELVLTTRDAGGRGMPAGDPDRGRGIALMRALMDDTRLDLGSHRGGTAVLRHRLLVAAGAPPAARRASAS
jgi:PAS domain S-box-containing protein